MLRRLAQLVVLASALVVAYPGTARADDNTAVELTKQAGDLYAKGAYQEALDRYQRADALVRRQTIVLRVARCLDKLGRLVEALERYQQVVEMELSADLEPRKRALQEEAVEQAKQERAALESRVPRVTLRLTGRAADVAAARATIDGRSIDLAAPAPSGIPLDPGTHELVVTVGESASARSVVLVEGDRKVVEVPIEAAPAPKITPPPPQITPPLVPIAPRVEPTDQDWDPARTRRTAGFVTLGIGGAGIVVGSILGGLIVAKHGELVDQCGDELVCPASMTEEVDAYNTGRIVSSAVLIVGSVVAATGLVVVLTALPSKKPMRAAVVLRPGGLGLAGAF